MKYDRESRSIINVLISFLVLPTLAVALLFAARWKRGLMPMPGDYFMLFSYSLHVTFCACCLAALNNPYGTVDTSEIPSTEKSLLDRIYLLLFVSSVLIVSTVFFAKISVCFFYRSIFRTANFRRANNFVIVFTVLSFLTFFFMVVFRCHPVRASWDFTLIAEPNVCLDYGNVVLAFEIINCIGDVLIIGLPVRELYKLQIPLSKKLGLSFVFALGAFVIVTSIIPAVVSWGKQALPFPQMTIWTAIQQACCIIGGCLPSYPGLIPDFVRPKLRAIGKWVDKKLVSTGVRF